MRDLLAGLGPAAVEAAKRSVRSRTWPAAMSVILARTEGDPARLRRDVRMSPCLVRPSVGRGAPYAPNDMARSADHAHARRLLGCWLAATSSCTRPGRSVGRSAGGSAGGRGSLRGGRTSSPP